MNHDWRTTIQCSQCLGVQTPENAADESCSGMVLNRRYDYQWERAQGIARREDGALPKEALVHGKYYYGRCRNASIARWDGVKSVFIHWRQKFSDVFLEEIACREDELHFDCFDAFYELEQSIGLNPIPVSDIPKEPSS